MPIKDIKGQRFGRLTVLEFSHLGPKAIWWVLCDCGTRKTVMSGSLTYGATKSCGCLGRENALKNLKSSKTHGHYSNGKRSPTYHTWSSMKTRCNKPNHVKYHLYGGRGIKVCDRWNKFENFLADMGVRPEGTTIDRIDSNGNYEPGNCRWATIEEQNQNRIFGRKRKLKTAA